MLREASLWPANGAGAKQSSSSWSCHGETPLQQQAPAERGGHPTVQKRIRHSVKKDTRRMRCGASRETTRFHGETRPFCNALFYCTAVMSPEARRLVASSTGGGVYSIECCINNKANCSAIHHAEAASERFLVTRKLDLEGSSQQKIQVTRRDVQVTRRNVQVTRRNVQSPEKHTSHPERHTSSAEVARARPPPPR